jgi:hypothetical protein
MGADQNPDERVAELQKQVSILQQQLALVNAQVTLDFAKQSQEAKISKEIAEALKNQATAQFSLASEQAKLPLAELAGIKAALSGMQLPAGKTGTVQIAAGTAGTVLLRNKGPMVSLLHAIADELKDQLPDGAVIVTETQLDQAYQADFTLKRIDDQTQKLTNAINAALSRVSRVQAIALPAFAAAAYSVGFVLDTINSLAKLFRVDRKADVFAADAEVVQMLGYFLEGKNMNFVANPAMIRKEALTEAETLLNKLNGLLTTVHKGDDALAQLKKIEEEEAKTKPSSSQLPGANVITELKAQLESSKSILDGLHPAKKPDAFWTQVKGQLIWLTLKDRDRLLLEGKGQVVQINESRWYKSDCILASGEVQVAYRVLDPEGKVKKTGVILKASKAERVKLQEMPEFFLKFF